MTPKDVEFAIEQGPSKFDLMLSLFDTDRGKRTVRFRIGRVPAAYEEEAWYEVQITSARRRHPSAKIWEMEGIVETGEGEKRVSIYYTSDTREGRMRFEEKLRTRGIMETPDDSLKAKTLIDIIFRMIHRYREKHLGDLGNLDEEMFKFFEKAKRVHYADTRDSLTRAIESI